MAMLHLSMYTLHYYNNVVFIIVTFYVCISDTTPDNSVSSGVEQEVIDIRQQHCQGGMNYCL